MFGQIIRKYNGSPEIEAALTELHNAVRYGAEERAKQAEKKDKKVNALVTKKEI